jgi:hypothetical protein
MAALAIVTADPVNRWIGIAGVIIGLSGAGFGLRERRR